MLGYVVQMLDDAGAVTEECLAVLHDSLCEDDYDPDAMRTTPAEDVEGLDWTTTDGMHYFVCWKHLATDDYVNVKVVAL